MVGGWSRVVGLNLLDIWDFDAFQLRGVTACEQFSTYLPISHSRLLKFVHCGFPMELLRLFLAGGAIPFNVQVERGVKFGRIAGWSTVYRGSTANVYAVVGMFMWWHAQHGLTLHE